MNVSTDVGEIIERVVEDDMCKCLGCVHAIQNII